MSKHRRLTRAQEIGEASRLLPGEPIGVVSPTRSNFLIDTAKKLQRLETKKARLTRAYNKAMRELKADMKLTKKELKAVANEIGKGG